MLVFTQPLETADKRLKIEEIFHTYGNLMFHVANKILNNDHDAEDAVQQALALRFVVDKSFYLIFVRTDADSDMLFVFVAVFFYNNYTCAT